MRAHLTQIPRRFLNRTPVLDRFSRSGTLEGVVIAIGVSIAAGFSIATTGPAPLLGVVLIAVAPLIVLRTSWSLSVALSAALLIPAPALFSGSLGPVPLGPLIGAVAVGTSVLVLVLERRTVVFSTYAVVAIAALSTGGVIGGVLGARSDLISTVTLVAVWAGAFVAGSVFGQDGKQLERLVWIFTGIAALAIVEAVLGSNPYAAVLGELRFSADQAEGFHRSTATFGHPLVAGAAFTTVAVLAFTSDSRSARLAAPVLLLAAVTTVSRSVGIGVIVALIVILTQAGPRRGRIAALASVGLVLGLGVASQLPLVRESFNNRVVEQSYAQTARENGYAQVLRTLGNAPQTAVIGGGLRSTQRELQAAGGNAGVSTFDNQLISLVYDVGLAALVIGLAAGVMAVRASSTQRRRHGLAAFLSLGSMMLFYDGLYWFSTGALFFMIFGALTAHESMRDRGAAFD